MNKKNFFQKSKTNLILICNQVLSYLLILFFISTIFSCKDYSKYYYIPVTNCDDIKELQYSIINYSFYLTLARTDEFVAYTPEDSNVESLKYECCIRFFNKDSLTQVTCVPCTSLKDFVNSQLIGCTIEQ
ncbi:MAG TPA: hypothetical protein PKD00_01610 [Burkholderiales bacterium]|nr:hypothetical protein [Burkholderiales bacterium]